MPLAVSKVVSRAKAQKLGLWRSRSLFPRRSNKVSTRESSHTEGLYGDEEQAETFVTTGTERGVYRHTTPEKLRVPPPFNNSNRYV